MKTTFVLVFAPLAVAVCPLLPSVSASVPPGDYRGVAFGNGVFVAARNTGEGTALGSEVILSMEGRTWTPGDRFGELDSLSFANDSFYIGVTSGGAFYSTTGTSWTSGGWPANAGINDLHYGTPGYFAVTRPDFGGKNLSFSLDPTVSWSQMKVGQPQSLNGVTYGDSIFVAVGDGGQVATSPNGSLWTVQAAGTSVDLHDVAHNNGLFVAVGVSGTVLSSPDGVTWTPRDSGTTRTLLRITEGAGQVVAVGEAGTIVTSTDGLAWTSRASTVSTTLNDLTYGNDTFVVVGDSTTILISSDGATWTSFDTEIAVDYGEAVEAPALSWSSGGNNPWSVQTTSAHDGMDAAQSGAIGNFEQSWLQTTVTGPGTAAFWWKVSSEMDYDVLEFSVDGTRKRRISGLEEWERVSIAIASGPRVLRWRYIKDDSTGRGLDRAWLDEVVFAPDSGPPVIPAQPASRKVGLGDTISLEAGVGGETPRSYQWYRNNQPIGGATEASLTLSNVSLADAGNYHLVVNNSSGVISSSQAILDVTTVGPVESILLFHDQSVASPYQAALINLGRAFELFTDYNDFHTAVTEADPATMLAVVDAPGINAPFNALGHFAEAGGRAILQCWTLSTDAVLAPCFNARVTTALLSSPQPVYDWTGTGFFTGLDSPIQQTDRFTFSGQRLQPADGGKAVAGYTSTPTTSQAAVVAGHSGRTIFNAFMLEEIDVSGTATRFAQNQLEYLLALRTPQLVPAAMADGQFEVVFIGTAGLEYSLQASANAADWTTVLTFLLSHSSTNLSVPASTSIGLYRTVTPPAP